MQYTNFVFDELGLVKKPATNPRTSHKETPRNNKNSGCKVRKGLISLR
jgi:hypothetical protein